jgi:osmotically-inducible protein OsmY
MNKMKRLTLSILCVAALTLPAFAADQSKTGKAAKQTSSDTADADNTDKNDRDRSGESKTSGDQSESAQDIKTTAAIRRAVVADKSLTMTATNVKIITANGVVTLRGPVNTAAEKSKIGELAKKNAGQAKIDNQLEVKKSN